MFQGKCRKELQGQIDDKEQQIEKTKQRLGDIVRGYGYSSVDSFMRIYRNTKADYADYAKRLKEWEEKYGIRYVEEYFEKKQKSFMFNNTNMQKK